MYCNLDMTGCKKIGDLESEDAVAIGQRIFYFFGCLRYCRAHQLVSKLVLQSSVQLFPD